MTGTPVERLCPPVTGDVTCQVGQGQAATGGGGPQVLYFPLKSSTGITWAAEQLEEVICQSAAGSTLAHVAGGPTRCSQ